MKRIAAVIPCFKCKDQILPVLNGIGREVDFVIVVDDKCPQKTGEWVKNNCYDPRVEVIFHAENQGVGGAVITAYRRAREKGADIAVKIDGDGQMNPKLIPQFAAPIIALQADYVKGNRFYDIENVRAMPRIRLVGNAALSFLSKLSSGYWDLFDPTNGYTALNLDLLDFINTKKISRRFFFESDMLFRLNLVRAVIKEIPMKSVYADEKSTLKISRVIHEFALNHLQNFAKRICYNYFLRNFSIASLELICGVFLLSFGSIYGSIKWFNSFQNNTVTPAGTVMLAALTFLIGIQFILAFLNYDIRSVPQSALGKILIETKKIETFISIELSER